MELLETHIITRQAYEHLFSDDFERFLAAREDAIINKIKKAIGYEEAEPEKTLILPQRPYTNKAILVRTLKTCGDHIYWLDKYFSKMGLELLSEAVDKELKEIRIIMAAKKADRKFRGLFKDFRKELSNKNIPCECRVLTDSKILSAVHDRFIIGKHNAYNIPSPDIVARGQLSEVTKSDNRVELLKEFNTMWKDSKDLIQDWNEIQKEVGSTVTK